MCVCCVCVLCVCVLCVVYDVVNMWFIYVYKRMITMCHHDLNNILSFLIPESIAKGSSVRSPAEKIHRVKYIE